MAKSAAATIVKVVALLTVGHSNHTLEAFLELLGQHRVALVADIRSIPHSKRHPHFSRDALEAALRVRGIGYRHFPALGGKREISYAGHMATLQFRAGLDQLLAAANDGIVTAMCAEADPLHCHRRLVADAAAARGGEVRHILPGGGIRNHEYHPGLFDGGE